MGHHPSQCGVTILRHEIAIPNKHPSQITGSHEKVSTPQGTEFELSTGKSFNSATTQAIKPKDM
jgi:hypothetical protein